MSKTVLMEYKNKKIHSKDEDMKGNTYYYCDSNRTEIKKVIKTKILEFKDFYYEKNVCTIKIKKDKENNEVNKITKEKETHVMSIKEDSFFSRYEKVNLDESKTLYETIDLNNCELSFNISFGSNSKTDKIHYSGICFELLEIQINDTDKSLASGKIKMELSYYICAECGEKLPMNFHHDSRTKLLGMYVFNDDTNIKLTMMYKQINTHGHLAWSRYYKDMIVYKKQTGKIYKVNNFNFAGSKYMKKKYPKRIQEITFCCATLLRGETFRGESLEKGYKAINNLIIEDLKERTGQDFEYAITDVNNYKKSEEFSYIYLLQMKRKYNINNIYLAKLLLEFRYSCRNVHKHVKNMTEKEMMQFFKLNKKKLKKIDETESYLEFVTFYDLLDDVNSMNELIESKKILTCNRPEAKYKDFLYQYRKNNTERKFLNQIKKIKYHYTLADTVRLFQLIKEKMKDYAVDYSKSIEELHDIFSKDYNKMQHQNQKIPQDKNIKKMFEDINIEGITYSPAKDTDELIKIGAFMDICVGGYGEDAVNKKCIIVAGYNSENKPVTCIELRKFNKNYELYQVKKRKNKTPKQSECDELNKLFTEHEVTIRTSDIDDNRHNSLSENEGEIMVIERATYSRNIPEELREEILNEMNAV